MNILFYYYYYYWYKKSESTEIHDISASLLRRIILSKHGHTCSLYVINMPHYPSQIV